MLWIALSEKDTVTAAPEKCLWDAADHSRAKSGLKSREYSAPVLNLVGDIYHGCKVNSRYCDLHDASGYFSANITNRSACK
jgi:type I restriction enzyme M protein